MRMPPSRFHQIARALVLLWGVSLAAPAFAQQPAADPASPASAAAASAAAASADSTPPSELRRPGTGGRPIVGTIVFWMGAVLCMFLVARIVFREQWTELKTQRALIHRIGPFFPEFDIDSIKTWVERASPHLWLAWRTGDLDAMDAFLTPEFRAGADARFAEDAAKGWVHHTKFGKVLKVHTLGLYSIGDARAPADLELLMRIETRAMHAVVGADGVVLEGSSKDRQVQHFWTLRHDGLRWRLHQVVIAHGDKTQLGKKPELPPIMEWRRPSAPETAA
ncbi:MAG: putative lipid-binding transport protein (Tim44 family) [Bradymonadia bacterium]|jgi:predicted lipid-binding transport protein (Tim44 family)